MSAEDLTAIELLKKIVTEEEIKLISTINDQKLSYKEILDKIMEE